MKLVTYLPHYTDELVLMWRESFERAVGVSDPNPLKEQKQYFLEKILPKNEVLVAIDDRQVAGFIAASSESIAQLYIHTDYQHRGIGSRLLQWAKEQSCGRLWLYTFEKNYQARQFYENRGFSIIARGFEQTWQLEDIKYEWIRD